MTEKEQHETERKVKLASLRRTVEELPEGQYKHAMGEMLETLELVSTGVDEAHARIDIRKSDTEKLMAKLDKLAEIVALTSADSIERNKRAEKNSEITRHNSKVTKLITLASIGTSFFLLFGGAGMLKQMGVVSSAVKTLELILR
jgi:hypothetical protein